MRKAEIARELRPGRRSRAHRAYIRKNREHTIIANPEVRLVETEDKYWGAISAINEIFVNVEEALVRTPTRTLPLESGP